MHGHFRSRDKDGAHCIGSAIPENFMLHANVMALSFLEPELRARSKTPAKDMSLSTIHCFDDVKTACVTSHDVVPSSEMR